MPISIKEQTVEPLRERIDAFRKSIQPGQGWQVVELVEKFGASHSAINAVVTRHRWVVKRYVQGRPRLLLVNPRDLCQQK